MIRIAIFIIFFLVISPVFLAYSSTIEIIVDGQKYASIDEYKNKKVSQVKAKDIVIDPDLQAKQVLTSASYQGSFKTVLMDFKQNWHNPWPSFNVSALEFPERIQALADGRHEPLLLMADQDKVRLMSYTPAE